MDYSHIEKLVLRAKSGDEAFNIKNECYRALFKCVNLYNADSHRFVAYATNAIKNSVNHLIRVSVRRGSAEGPGALILHGSLSSILCEASESLEELVINQANRAKLKGIAYSAAVSKKTSILKKLKKVMDMPCRKSYLNYKIYNTSIT